MKTKAQRQREHDSLCRVTEAQMHLTRYIEMELVKKVDPSVLEMSIILHELSARYAREALKEETS